MANKNHYTIRQLVPATGFLAIWTMPVSVDGQEQPDGQVTLVTKPFDFLATAKVESLWRGEWADEGIEVVAVELLDCVFEVCDTFTNFWGIVREGATREECLALLTDSVRERVVDEPANSFLPDWVYKKIEAYRP